MSYFSDHLAWQQRVGQEANALARYYLIKLITNVDTTTRC